MSTQVDAARGDGGPSLITRLGLNRSTAALLGAILLIGMGQELWAPFMPKYIQHGIESRLHGGFGVLGLSHQGIIILAVGLFGFWKDLQEGIYYYFGGRIGGTLGTRRALILFAALPLIGYAMIGLTPTAYAALAAFLALPFIGAYDSISQPATLTVVGETLKAQHRTMAFSLQAIQRRIPRIIAYISGGALVTWLGAVGGVRAAVGLSAALVVFALIIQVAMLRSDTRDQAQRTAGFSLSLIRRFHPELRKLLAADVLARLAEGMPRELFIIYAVAQATTTGNSALPGFGVLGITTLMFGTLLAVQAFTSLMTYIPVGYIASRPGGEKKPFIALTFVFFAAFPLAFLLLGRAFGYWGLIGAFIIGGLREIGEPARKAMITELLPQDARTAATGLYWSVRSFCVMLAPLLGAVLWLTISPQAVFVTAFAVGIVGAVFFAVVFNRSVQGQERPPGEPSARASEPMNSGPPRR
jgi:MFS family permease